MYVYVACVVCVYNNPHVCSCVHPSNYEEISGKAILVIRSLGLRGIKDSLPILLVCGDSQTYRSLPVSCLPSAFSPHLWTPVLYVQLSRMAFF